MVDPTLGEAALDSSKPTIVLCHMGIRSMQMAEWLTTKAGFKTVYNVEGGIRAYYTDVDRSVGNY
jgi:rhodanese-related sulfurtransferase